MKGYAPGESAQRGRSRPASEHPILTIGLHALITRKYFPQDDLRRFVKSYFIQEIDIDTRGLLIPALTQTFVQFHYGQLYTMLHSTGRRVRFYPVTVSGMTTTYSFFAEENPRPRFLAAELQPYVPFLLFKERNRQLVNSSFNGADLLAPGTCGNRLKPPRIPSERPTWQIDISNAFWRRCRHFTMKRSSTPWR